jgi:hypothetical protein
MVIWSWPIISTTKLHSTWYSKIFHTLHIVLPKYRQNTFLIYWAVIKHGKSDNMLNIFVETLAGKETLGRHNHRKDHNLKMNMFHWRNHVKIWSAFMGQKRDQWQAFVNMMMNVGLPWEAGNKNFKDAWKNVPNFVDILFFGSRNTLLFIYW